MPKSSSKSFTINRTYVILLLLTALGLYVLLPQIGDFRASFHLLRSPKISWTVLAVICTASTYVFAAFTYTLLSFSPLRYGQTLLVQLAAMFVNRLMPGGVGALGVNFVYLQKNGHTKAQAASMVALNNVLGFAGNGLLLLLGVVIAGHSLQLGKTHHSSVVLIAIVAATLITVAVASKNKRLRRALKDLARQLMSYRQRLDRVALALLSSTCLTVANVACLYCCMQALGVHLSIASVLFILTLGVGAGTATPTPGGLGGFEAGLVGGFAAYHILPSTGLAIALLYRLLSYWLPLLIGAVAFEISRRQRLFI